MNSLLITLGLGLVVVAAVMAGAAIVVQRQWEPRYLKYFMALGAGFMLAAVLLEMVPQSFQINAHRAPLLIVLGYLVVHLFEHTLTPHFHFGEETHHPHANTGTRVLIALIVHNFFTGVAITSGFLISTGVGVLIFVAMLLHKMPEGFTIASVMLATGRSRQFAMLSALMLGGATLAGIATLGVFQGALSWGLPVSTGVALYVATSDLVPEVNKDPSPGVPFAVIIGVVLMLIVERVLLHGH